MSFCNALVHSGSICQDTHREYNFIVGIYFRKCFVYHSTIQWPIIICRNLYRGDKMENLHFTKHEGNIIGLGSEGRVYRLDENTVAKYFFYEYVQELCNLLYLLMVIMY